MRTPATLICLALAATLLACGNGQERSPGPDSAPTVGGDVVETPGPQVENGPDPVETSVPTAVPTPEPTATPTDTAVPTATPTPTEDAEGQVSP